MTHSNTTMRRCFGAARAGALTALAVAALTSRDPRPAHAQSPDSLSVRHIVGGVIRAYGGSAALARVHGYRIEGQVFPAGHDTAVAMTRVFERPNRLRVAIEYPDGAELRIYNGALGWRTSAHGSAPDSNGVVPPPRKPSPATGPALDAMALQAARANLPWILAERESLLRVVPPDSIGPPHPGLQATDPHVTLEMPLGEGLALQVVVDRASSEIVESHGILDRGGMSSRFDTIYSDYRRVNGVTFAFQERNFAGDVRTADIRFRSVVLNPKPGKAAFAP